MVSGKHAAVVQRHCRCSVSTTHAFTHRATACPVGPNPAQPRTIPALQKRAEQASLHFEKAAIAFNLGAVQVWLA